VLIEPSRRPMSEAAQVFLAMLETEAERLNARWLPDAPKPAARAASPRVPARS
jgi:hypothetical protein